MRVLLTGMSGTGKSSLVRRLAALRYRAIDTDDDGWCVPGDGSEPEGRRVQPDWVWDEPRMRELLATDAGPVLFVAGCVENQARFYPQFDRVVLLTAPPWAIVQRLTTRTSNSFGKSPGELAKVLEDQRVIDPLLRSGATDEVDTNAPFDEVVATVLRLVGG